MATITQIRAVSLVIVLCVACYAGVDVVPGSLDFQGEFEPTEGFKTSDFSLDDLGDGPERVVRLQNQDGQPITEAQEDELRSLLERLEQAFIADDLAKINFNKKLIKKKQVLPDDEVDALTQHRVNFILEQMAATTSLERFGLRVILFLAFVVCEGTGGGPSFSVVLLMELFLVFAPHGHEVTTASRHDDGGSSWTGSRRSELVVITLVHYGLAWCVQAFIGYYRFSIRKAAVGSAEGRAEGAAFKQKTSDEWVQSVSAVLAAPFFVGMAWRLVGAAPAGWLHGVTNEGFNMTECSAEFHEPLAREMQLAYLAFVGYAVLETTIASMSAPTLEAAFSKATGYPYWFWFLLMYYCPYDDAAVPMVMECIRLAAAATFCLMDKQDPIVAPITAVVEVLQWFITVLTQCHYPVVLWLRIPTLLSGTLITVNNIQHFLASGGTSTWVGPGGKVSRVTVYLADRDGDYEKPGGNLPPNAKWRVIEDVEVLLDTSPMSLGKNPAGAMRDPYRLFDSTGVIFGPIFEQSGIHGVDAHRLVYKKYRQNIQQHVQDIEFRDAWMQYEAGCLAERFNQQSPLAQDCFFTPVAVIKLADGSLYNVECFLTGRYKKWSSNHVIYEVLQKEDDVPTAFQHYTFAESGGELMVADVQGVEGTTGTHQYIFTDPQILSTRGGGNGQSYYGVGDMGPAAMTQFLDGHRCGRTCRAMHLNQPARTAEQNQFDAEILLTVEHRHVRQQKIAVVFLMVSFAFGAILFAQRWWSAYKVSSSA